MNIVENIIENINANIKKLLQTYKKINSPSKKIIKYGSLVSIELVMISIGLYIFYLVNPSSYYLDLSILLCKTSVTVFLELLISAFVFDYVFQS